MEKEKRKYLKLHILSSPRGCVLLPSDSINSIKLIKYNMAYKKLDFSKSFPNVLQFCLKPTPNNKRTTH